MAISTQLSAQRIPFGAPVLVYYDESDTWHPGRVSGSSGMWYYVMLEDGSDEPLVHPSLVRERRGASITLHAHSHLSSFAMALAFFSHANRIEVGSLRFIDAA